MYHRILSGLPFFLLSCGSAPIEPITAEIVEPFSSLSDLSIDWKNYRCEANFQGNRLFEGICYAAKSEVSDFAINGPEASGGCLIELDRNGSEVIGKLLEYKDPCWIDIQQEIALSDSTSGIVDLGVMSLSRNCWKSKQFSICLDGIAQESIKSIWIAGSDETWEDDSITLKFAQMNKDYAKCYLNGGGKRSELGDRLIGIDCIVREKH